MENTFNPGIAYAEFKQRRIGYYLAAIVAFIMSSYFVVGYLAGDLLFWNWNISQWMNGIAGTGLCAVVTIFQFVLYGQGDIEGGKKATILALCVAVGFSLLSEVGQGVKRDHVRMESKSIESPAYQALVQKIGTATGNTSHPYSSQLANAEMKLARCQQKVSTGEWSDCIESTARLNSVKSMITQHYQQNQNSAVALAGLAHKMENDERNYQPLVNVIREFSGFSAVISSFLLSLFLICCFEFAFHYLGKQFALKRNELISNGYDVTRRVRKTPKALKRMQIDNPPAPQESTWNDALSRTGIDAPEDEVLNQSADDEQARRIIDRAQGVSETAEKRILYGSNGDQNTEGDTEENTGLNMDNLHGQKFYKLIYAEVKLLVIKGSIKPTVRPVTDAVTTVIRHKSHLLGVKPSEIRSPMRQKIAQEILEHLERENIVVRNREGGVGKPKYLLGNEYVRNLAL